MTAKQRVKFVIKYGFAAAALAAMFPMGLFSALGLVNMLLDPGIRGLLCVPLLFVFVVTPAIWLWQWSLQPD